MILLLKYTGSSFSREKSDLATRISESGSIYLIFWGYKKVYKLENDEKEKRKYDMNKS